MPQQTKSKLIPLVIMAIAVLVVAGLILRENFAFSQEGKIVSKASQIDSDGDGLTDEEEAKYKTNPNQADSDGDGVSDLEEIQKGTDPNKADQIPGDVDSDGDGLINDEETKYGTDPFNPDTDQDGYSDGQEIVSGHDPLTPCEGCPKVAGDWAESLEGLTEGLDTEALLENIDTSPVELPEIPDSELNITDESGKEAVRKYFDEVDRVLKENLPFVLGEGNIRGYASKFPMIIKSQEKTKELTDKIRNTYSEIKEIPTPKECLELKRTTLKILSVTPGILEKINFSYINGDIQEYTSCMYKIRSLFDCGENIASEIIQLREKYNFE